MKLKALKTKHMVNPLGIDGIPYFSWKLDSDEPDTMQESYQIRVCDETGNTVWDSGERKSEETSFISYEGETLKSSVAYTWTVIVRDNHGNAAEASACFETALLNKSDWRAKWVESPLPQVKRKKVHGKQGPATYFHKSFSLSKKVKRARLYATAHGVYEAYLNGDLVDNRKFAPEHTSYEWYLCYQTYDVTDVLRQGENTIGFYVGDGWYCGVSCALKFKGFKPVHAILFQMEVEYEDGSRETILSDTDMTAGTGPVLSSDLFFGEKYDANLGKEMLSGRTAHTQVKPANYGYDTLSAQLGEPVKTVMELPCREVLHTAKGETVLDFGQVVCGAVRMKIDAPASTTVMLEHSEVLDKDGNFTTNILFGWADQTVEYVSDGESAVYEPHFSFQGFRYVRVTGLAEVKAEDFTAAVYSTEKEDLGTFACSDERINRLYENTRWSQRANMLSIPTDCPQREKAGWTGDIQVYATTSLLNEDTTSLLTRWMKSLAFEQKPWGGGADGRPHAKPLLPDVFAVWRLVREQGRGRRVGRLERRRRARPLADVPGYRKYPHTEGSVFVHEKVVRLRDPHGKEQA